MVKINLKLDDIYLLKSLINCRFVPYASAKQKKDVVDIQNFAYKISVDLYNEFRDRDQIVKFRLKNISFKKYGEQIDEYVETVIKSDEFK